MGYVLRQRLGRGGMGVVDLAVDEQGRPVALKHLALTGSVAELARARHRVRREVEALRSLRHPAVVPLLEVVEDDEDLVLVMPYLGGGTLADRVRTFGPMPPSQVRAMAPLLLDALAAAHRAGIVHRDVKPANVLFDERGHPYLADFGVARLRDATAGLTTTGLLGTPAFMAPEQARGEPATAASDVFALGATLAFALTGRGPYGDGDPRVLVHRAARGRTAALPATIPGDVRRALTPLLARDPRRRPSAAAAVRPWIRGAPAPAPRPAPGPAGAPPPRPAAAARRTPDRRARPGPALRTAALAVAVVIAVVAAGLALTATLAVRPDGTGSVRTPTTEPVPTTAPCTPLPYQPCGAAPAPFTDGVRCTLDHADYDGVAANGCEAAPDGVDGRRLDRAVRANLVPGDDVDRYPFHVDDRFDLFCDGTLQVTLTAPPGATMRVDVQAGPTTRGSATSRDGRAATVTLTESSCLGDDSADLVATVSWAGGARTAADYALERKGSF